MALDDSTISGLKGFVWLVALLGLGIGLATGHGLMVSLGWGLIGYVAGAVVAVAIATALERR